MEYLEFTGSAEKFLELLDALDRAVALCESDPEAQEAVEYFRRGVSQHFDLDLSEEA